MPATTHSSAEILISVSFPSPGKALRFVLRFPLHRLHDARRLLRMKREITAMITN